MLLKPRADLYADASTKASPGITPIVGLPGVRIDLSSLFG